ncbi:MAG: NADPH-dependent 7-cyano-7-deazaguanine reductase QueF, partial [Proteobacteria bacterium]|nr:NADPH-dependent 7-cyano-7-deazaguanine reductase QueF [Pseudomonadota bacterium]
MEKDLIIDQSPLGKPTVYRGEYNPDLLFPIARSPFRKDLGIESSLPFYGHDLWNAYELSWLDNKGKPISAIAQFLFPCTSPNLIEAKSFKLYLNSFHQTRLNDLDTITGIIKKDLSVCAGSEILLEIAPLTTIHSCELGRPHGFCLDNLDIEVDEYQVNPSLLKTEIAETTEAVYSDIFKSNCLGTGQPDWGTIVIQYSGKKINHESLLKYLISFRQHKEFGEHCVERIFMDIWRCCQPVN